MSAALASALQDGNANPGSLAVPITLNNGYSALGTGPPVPVSLVTRAQSPCEAGGASRPPRPCRPSSQHAAQARPSLLHTLRLVSQRLAFWCLPGQPRRVYSLLPGACENPVGLMRPRCLGSHLLSGPPQPAERVCVTAWPLSCPWAASCSQGSGGGQPGAHARPQGPLKVGSLGYCAEEETQGQRRVPSALSGAS